MPSAGAPIPGRGRSSTASAIANRAPSSPSRLAAGAGHKMRTGAKRLRGREEGRGGECFRAVVDAHEEGDVGARAPAVFLGEGDAQDAVLGKEPFDVLRIFGLLIDLSRTRSDPVLHELSDRVPNRDLLLREIEVHPGYWITSRAITIRCTWLDPS